MRWRLVESQALTRRRSIPCSLLGPRDGIKWRIGEGSDTIKLYTTPKCARCSQLKRWLQSRGIRYKELDLSDTEVAAELIMNNIFVLSAPILRIDGKFLGPDKVFKDGKLEEELISDLIKRG